MALCLIIIIPSTVVATAVCLQMKIFFNIIIMECGRYGIFMFVDNIVNNNFITGVLHQQTTIKRIGKTRRSCIARFGGIVSKAKDIILIER